MSVTNHQLCLFNDCFWALASRHLLIIGPQMHDSSTGLSEFAIHINFKAFTCRKSTFSFALYQFKPMSHTELGTL